MNTTCWWTRLSMTNTLCNADRQASNRQLIPACCECSGQTGQIVLAKISMCVKKLLYDTSASQKRHMILLKTL